MTAATYQDNRIIDFQMSGPFVGSMIFHVVVIVLLMIGIPFITQDIPVMEEPIAVEIVNESTAMEEIKQSEKIVKERPPMNEIEPPKVLPKVMPKVTEMPKPEAPSPPDTADDLAPPVKDKTPVKPVKPVAKPKPTKKPDKKVTEEVQEQEFKSVLKNLLPDEPVQGEEKKDVKKLNSAESGSMTKGEFGALNAQLARCWKLMSGARYAEDLVVELRVFVNPDRTLRDAQVINTLRYNTDTYYRSAADSALRAMRDPQCNPLDLPPQKYDLWKVMIIPFDPSKML